ncbi:Uncharacterised protein [Dermatophilus congolensis]|uniref:Uncharacterized protein n=1 Tax=Dermatophilus congolensis TaxID=1863 RepID=A0AA46BL44_9MICO|nr:Uncharacterised protein [Dermatophilus congolensis]
MWGEGLFDVGGEDFEAAGVDDVVGAAFEGEGAVGVDVSDVVGEVCAGAVGVVCEGCVCVEGEGGGVVGGVEVSVGDVGACELDACGGGGVVCEGDGGVADGVAVVDAAAAGFAHAVCGDEVDVVVFGAVDEFGGGCCAADEDGVELAQCGDAFGGV